MVRKRDNKRFDDYDDIADADLTLSEALRITLETQIPSRLPKEYLLEAAFWCGVSAVLDMWRDNPLDLLNRVSKQHDEAYTAFQAKVRAWVDPQAQEARQAMRLVARWESVDTNVSFEVRHDGGRYWIFTKNSNGLVPEPVEDDEQAIKLHEAIAEALSMLTDNPAKKLRRVQ
jgi:hypothetical protein